MHFRYNVLSVEGRCGSVYTQRSVESTGVQHLSLTPLYKLLLPSPPVNGFVCVPSTDQEPQGKTSKQNLELVHRYVKGWSSLRIRE